MMLFLGLSFNNTKHKIMQIKEIHENHIIVLAIPSGSKFGIVFIINSRGINWPMFKPVDIYININALRWVGIYSHTKLIESGSIDPVSIPVIILNTIIDLYEMKNAWSIFTIQKRIIINLIS